ncbi:WbqC family protein [Massilia rhizosphaerae]|uniref:WbqC family protein n=1 Tax=Massilia rhizosphaerae TaxID=2784389 RepID=UPI0018DDA555|nr:WbqC family protein [Massilia rhizosphaerae]
MKYAIMQPYFFPYVGYYSLIKATDRFILFDDVQFIRHGWIERNRILKPEEGWQYVAVPLEKFEFGAKIKDVKIRNAEDWKGKLLRQLQHYKKRSPFYADTVAVIERSLQVDTDSITHLNANVLRETCKYIGVNLQLDIFSEMQLAIDPVTHPGEWALHITKALGGTEYVNPTGGVEIFKPEQFQDAQIKLKFLGNNLEPYSQRRGTFETGLSIIDVMMFNSPERIRELLDDTYCL